MITRISQSGEILAKLTQEGKANVIDSVGFTKATEELNKKMQDVRRDYKQKDSDSQKSASVVTLTS